MSQTVHTKQAICALLEALKS